MKRNVKKYKLLFNFFSEKQIAAFLQDLSKLFKNTHNQDINECALNTNLFPEIQEKIDKSFSSSSLAILQVILSCRDIKYFKQICRFLKSKLDLNKDYIEKIENPDNCGLIVYKNSKKIDLSLEEYLNQLKLCLLKKKNGVI